MEFLDVNTVLSLAAIAVMEAAREVYMQGRAGEHTRAREAALQCVRITVEWHREFQMEITAKHALYVAQVFVRLGEPGPLEALAASWPEGPDRDYAVQLAERAAWVAALRTRLRLVGEIPQAAYLKETEAPSWYRRLIRELIDCAAISAKKVGSRVVLLPGVGPVDLKPEADLGVNEGFVFPRGRDAAFWERRIREVSRCLSAPSTPDKVTEADFIRGPGPILSESLGIPVLSGDSGIVFWGRPTPETIARVVPVATEFAGISKRSLSAPLYLWAVRLTRRGGFGRLLEVAESDGPGRAPITVLHTHPKQPGVLVL